MFQDFQVVFSHYQKTDPIQLPFDLDERYANKVRQGFPPVLHLWQHPQAFVAGLRDEKLPFFDKASQWLEEQGYQVAVRNSGGAAVPLDDGVLNFSWIVPKENEFKTIEGAFEMVFQWVNRTLEPFAIQINKGEIVGAYCPGSYDLSVNQKKICGVAQRRLLNVVIVQAFVLVEGSTQKKTELVQYFYRTAVNQDQNEHNIPKIRSDTMTTLNDINKEITMAFYLKHLLSFLQSNGGSIAGQ